jgi:thiamine kinase-like enzyme
VANLLSNEQLLAAINTLPSFEDVRLNDMTRLSGGLCNVNVRVKLAERAVVVRFLTVGNSDNPVNRRQEFYHQQLAAKHQLAPMPDAFYDMDSLYRKHSEAWSPLLGLFSAVMVVEYCVGDVWSSLGQLTDIKNITTGPLVELANILACVHQIPYQAAESSHQYLTPADRLSHYWTSFYCQYPKLAAQYQTLMTELIDQVTGLDTESHCLIHGDVNGGNIIVGPSTVQLIDWEFSAYDDPYIDLASAIVELKLAPAARTVFLTHYSSHYSSHYPNMIQAVNQQRLVTFEAYYCALCWLWLQLQPGELAADADKDYYYRRLGWGGLKRNVSGAK